MKLPLKKSRYNQGKRRVTKKDNGYHLDEGIVIYRSSYELKAIDLLSQLYRIGRIQSWRYEADIFKYNSSIDGSEHRYHMDFTVVMSSGKTVFIEVKPYNETIPPKKSRLKATISERALVTYIRNQDKWKRVQEFVDTENRKAKKILYGFAIWTEKDLGLEKKPKHNQAFYKKKHSQKRKK